MKHDTEMTENHIHTETGTRSPEGAITIMGVRIHNITDRTAMDRITDGVTRKGRSGSMSVFFTNVHTIHLAKKNQKFRTIINNCDLMLSDGSGLTLAGKLFGTPILQNLNGTDFTPGLFSKAMHEGWTIYLLGARPNVVERCRAQLLERYPDLKIVGYHDGHSLQEHESAIIGEIKTKQPDILFIALGSPLQESWIASHAHEINAGISMGVGGLFDFIAGERKRAPRWMRRLGLEWVYRFLQDPVTKWKRVFVEIPVFLFHVSVEWMKRRYGKSVHIREEVSL
jgi:N-acetylglucosaminyldiphosphoundecaprenol N-acetyl-beta-D-mannosaminyltransferase